MNLEIEFDEDQRAEKVKVLEKKIKYLNNRVSQEIADEKDKWKLN